MDDVRFDSLLRSVDRFATRRAALRAAGAGALAASLAAFGFGAEAKTCKKPKVACGKNCCAAGSLCVAGKCAAACTFKKTATRWTLQEDCATAKTIEIPNGVTLDGKNKTITMTGPASGFANELPNNFRAQAAVLANGGKAHVRNLTLVGKDIAGRCSRDFPEGIVFINAAGTIKNVTVSDVVIKTTGGLRCGSSISATATGGQKVGIEDATVSGSARGIWLSSRLATAGIDAEIVDASVADMVYGVLFTRGVRGTLSDSLVKGSLTGVGVTEDSEVTIENCTLRNNDTGGELIFDGDAPSRATFDGNTISSTSEQFGLIASQGSLVARDNAITGMQIGIGAINEEASAECTGNTIVGPGPTSGAAGAFAAGIAFDFGATGSVDGNTISDYFDDTAGQVGCGILVTDEAGEVEIGDNDFPDPPGNEQDVCEPPALLRAGRDDGQQKRDDRGGPFSFRSAASDTSRLVGEFRDTSRRDRRAPQRAEGR